MKTKAGAYLLKIKSKEMDELNKDMLRLAKLIEAIKQPKKQEHYVLELAARAKLNRIKHAKLQADITAMVQLEWFLQFQE